MCTICNRQLSVPGQNTRRRNKNTHSQEVRVIIVCLDPVYVCLTSADQATQGPAKPDGEPGALGAAVWASGGDAKA